MFKPNVTVACIIEHKNRFLLVEEEICGRRVFNQPAGHLERDESLPEACKREVYEETGLKVSPDGLVGVYLYPVKNEGLTFLRFCFYCQLKNPPPTHEPKDPDILATHWMTANEITKNIEQLRSPMVLTCLNAFLVGERIDINRIHALL